MSSATCAHHPERNGADVCSRCGDFICLECRRFTPEGQLYCPGCNPNEGASKVGQLKILGTLLIVHGGLLACMALVGLFGIGMTGTFAAQVARDPVAQNGPMGAEGVGYMLYAIYGTIAVIAVILGPLQILAGIGALRQRGRKLILVALIGGLAALITVYCAPTAIALSVWGLILLNRADVVKAFERNEELRR